MHKDDENNALNKAAKTAEKIARSGEEIDKLLSKARAKADKNRGKLQALWFDLQLLYELLQDYRKGHYRKVPWKFILAAVAAIVYFLNPIDLIPDFLGPLGFSDDATVVAILASTFRDELEAYKRFAGYLPDPQEDQ